MSERDGYEPGVPCWVATIQPDPEAAAAFYGELFGWDYADGGGFLIARLRGRDVAAVAPLPPGVDPPPPPDWIADIWIDSADDAAGKARSAGGTVLAEPFDGPAGRVTVIADPAGAVFAASERRLHKGAQLVNEPGTWSMTRLDTPDPDGAQSFYATLFGWSTETFQLGENRATLFRLPGYVGRRARAARLPRGRGDDVRGHRRRARALERRLLGARRRRHRRDRREAEGTILVAPFDIPISRSAVLADPAGATFSVTQINRAR